MYSEILYECALLRWEFIKEFKKVIKKKRIFFLFSWLVFLSGSCFLGRFLGRILVFFLVFLIAFLAEFLFFFSWSLSWSSSCFLTFLFSFINSHLRMKRGHMMLSNCYNSCYTHNEDHPVVATHPHLVPQSIPEVNEE